jgi:hypothetical protein
MNTALSTPVDEQNHVHPPSRVGSSVVHRVGLADRVALHLGLALITWSRRPRTVALEPTRDQLCARYARSVERTDREWKAERAVRLGLPTR